MAGRPQNYCRDCGRQWFVTAHAPAVLCPGCGGPRVGAVLSLDDAEPPPLPPPPPPRRRSSLLPKVLVYGAVGAALHITAGVLAVHRFRNDPAPPPVEVAAAGAATPAPSPTPAPRPTARPKAPTPPAAKGGEPAEPPSPAPPAESDRTAPTPGPGAVAPAPVPMPAPIPAPPMPMPPTPGATTPKPPAPGQGGLRRPAHPFPPPSGGWESDWQKVGDVRVRVCGVAVAQVPVERRKQESMSKDRYLVVWLDIENTSGAAHTYRRWQPVLTGECTLRYTGGGAVPYALYPPETGRLWFSEFNQPLPPGGPPVLESLAFSRPDVNTPGDLTLTLDATRVGAPTGRYAITIPHAVWARP